MNHGGQSLVAVAKTALFAVYFVWSIAAVVRIVGDFKQSVGGGGGCNCRDPPHIDRAAAAIARLATPRNSAVLLNAVLATNYVLGRTLFRAFLGPPRAGEGAHLRKTIVHHFLYQLLFAASAVRQTSYVDAFVWLVHGAHTVLLLGLSVSAARRFDAVAREEGGSVRVRRNKRLFALALLLLLYATWLQAWCAFMHRFLGAALAVVLSFRTAGILVHNAAVVAKFALHEFDFLRHGGTWDRRAHAIFHVDLAASFLRIAFSCAQYLQLIAMRGISLCLLDFVLLFKVQEQLLKFRALAIEYKMHCARFAEFDALFPLVDREELARRQDKTCPICLVDMADGAVVLPCGHIFHRACLLRWLERQETCPTCKARLPLGHSIQQQQQHPLHRRAADSLARFFGAHRTIVTQEMVQSVLELVPTASRDVVIRALLQTGSVETTVNLLLDGRLGPLRETSPPPPPPPPPAEVRQNQHPSSPCPPSSQPRAEAASTGTMPTLPDGFAETPEKRHQSLQARKAALLAYARQRHLQEQQQQEEDSSARR